MASRIVCLSDALQMLDLDNTSRLNASVRCWMLPLTHAMRIDQMQRLRWTRRTTTVFPDLAMVSHTRLCVHDRPSGDWRLGGLRSMSMAVRLRREGLDLAACGSRSGPPKGNYLP